MKKELLKRNDISEVNWLRLEQRIRKALQNLKEDRELHLDDAIETLSTISAILGEETGRGYELEE